MDAAPDNAAHGQDTSSVGVDVRDDECASPGEPPFPSYQPTPPPASARRLAGRRQYGAAPPSTPARPGLSGLLVHTLCGRPFACCAAAAASCFRRICPAADEAAARGAYKDHPTARPPRCSGCRCCMLALLAGAVWLLSVTAGYRLLDAPAGRGWIEENAAATAAAAAAAVPVPSSLKDGAAFVTSISSQGGRRNRSDVGSARWRTVRSWFTETDQNLVAAAQYRLPGEDVVPPEQRQEQEQEPSLDGISSLSVMGAESHEVGAHDTREEQRWQRAQQAGGAAVTDLHGHEQGGLRGGAEGMTVAARALVRVCAPFNKFDFVDRTACDAYTGAQGFCKRDARK